MDRILIAVADFADDLNEARDNDNRGNNNRGNREEESEVQRFTTKALRDFPLSVQRI